MISEGTRLVSRLGPSTVDALGLSVSPEAWSGEYTPRLEVFDWDSSGRLPLPKFSEDFPRCDASAASRVAFSGIVVVLRATVLLPSPVSNCFISDIVALSLLDAISSLPLLLARTACSLPLVASSDLLLRGVGPAWTPAGASTMVVLRMLNFVVSSSMFPHLQLLPSVSLHSSGQARKMDPFLCSMYRG